jgi:hypothetical protein
MLRCACIHILGAAPMRAMLYRRIWLSNESKLSAFFFSQNDEETIKIKLAQFKLYKFIDWRFYAELYKNE